ncbi:low affinity iron permease family protein [Glycomyces niveus]|uniref:Low affinity iron permease family protein n=1 Tax=Glycomyces niveus TaxID=2820287 RepID=A0ABS3U788_9ACTN|nr:low affinity iron permease family protein [Glycomyces sp. NEAU-S30]MBO3734615.1 low affinity iron permease family protein [Glycomyces sp. NEAU-S30]
MTSKAEKARRDKATMPKDVTPHLGFFDRMASRVASFTARAWFFSICVATIIIWAPSVVLFDLSTWQLIINTTTTIVTFLLVALLQNTETRANDAVQQKLNAIADALAELMEASHRDSEEMQEQVRQLRKAVGLEDEESA